MNKLLLCGILAASLTVQVSHASRQTVCTITVNSADEKEAFKRYLPPDRFQFVELVERNRPDWLASACRTAVQCDVLVISGHYDGGNEFFSDRVDVEEFLPIAELERASCSDLCTGLFSKLKEVYLFGCNTLNPQAQRSGSAEVARSLVRAGLSQADADRLARSLNAGHGESSRDRMRLMFKDVPVIYGFSSVAPLGPAAASTLSRHLQTAGTGEVGTGRGSSRMLEQFAANSMVMTRGMTDADPHADVRRNVCRFAGDQASDVEKIAFIHQLLKARMAEVRMYLDRIEEYATSLDDRALRTPEVTRALEAIARDDGARKRYLDFARDADQPAVQARMLSVARMLGWLSPQQRRTEIMRMIDELLDRNAVGATDVDLACSLNKENDLDGEMDGFARPPIGRPDDIAHAAMYACLGSVQAHVRTLQGVFSSVEADGEMAQVYLRHRPIVDVDELRMVAAGIATMREPKAQVRALEALGRHRLSDPQSLNALVHLYPTATFWTVQAAIAGILIRADYDAFDRPELVRTLRENRRKSPLGDNMIDTLIRRLQLP